MIKLKFKPGDLSPTEQQVISDGFNQHCDRHSAPRFKKDRLNWLAYRDETIVGAVTADQLWDWLYIDELIVDPTCRGTGLGKKLMIQAEEYAASQNLTGLWLWTQSWEAEEFYKHLGYQEFTRFQDFPKGHERIGLRKLIIASG